MATIKIHYLFSIVPCFFFLNLIGQNEEDALRYSYLQYGGTARYIGVGGAFGALGADLSVLSTNPAGMARYKRSEFSFSPNISLTNSSTSWNENQNTNGKENINVSNFGIVGVGKSKKENNSKWARYQIGLSYNRLADFNDRYTIQGENNASMSYVFADRSHGHDPHVLADNLPFDGNLAYETFITDYDTINGIYTTRMNNDIIHHEHEVTRKGRVGEYVVAFSTDYNHKIYLGGSIGFPGIRFEETKTHYENEIQDSTETTQSFTFHEYQLTTGTGINAKLGLIYLPTHWLRLGAAYHTKTNYSMSDFWYSNMSSTISPGLDNDSESPHGNFSYRLKTPSKFIGSLSMIIAKKGLISIDYSRIDHRQSVLLANKYYSNGYNFEAENNAIDSNYTITQNIQIGTEFKLGKFFMARAGYAYFQNPFEDETENSYNRISYSVGFGYRNKNYFLDFGYRLSTWTEDYYMYDPAIVDVSNIDKSLSNFMLTFGFKW